MLDTINATVSGIEKTVNDCNGELHTIATKELPELRGSIDVAKEEIPYIKKTVYERLDAQDKNLESRLKSWMSYSNWPVLHLLVFLKVSGTC